MVRSGCVAPDCSCAHALVAAILSLAPVRDSRSRLSHIRRESTVCGFFGAGDVSHRVALYSFGCGRSRWSDLVNVAVWLLISCDNILVSAITSDAAVRDSRSRVNHIQRDTNTVWFSASRRSLASGVLLLCWSWELLIGRCALKCGCVSLHTLACFVL